MLFFLIALALWGLVVGALARLALPGPDPMGVLATIGLGLAGSFIGGVIAVIFFHRGVSFVFAVLVSTLLLYLHRRYVQHRPLTGGPRRRW